MSKDKNSKKESKKPALLNAKEKKAAKKAKKEGNTNTIHEATHK